MSTNDPKRDDDRMEEFRRALTSHNTASQEESRDHTQATLGGAAERDTESPGTRAQGARSQKEPQRESELDDFRQALTQGRSQMPRETESGMDRFRSALGNAAGRGAGWVSDQVHQGLQGFVNHVLLGGSSSPELADKHQEQAHEQAQERDKGMDR